MQQGQPGVKNTLFVPPNNYPIRAFGALLDMLPNKVQPVYYSHSYPFDLLSVFCSLLKKNIKFKMHRRARSNPTFCLTAVSRIKHNVLMTEMEFA